ncbi:hypothetical protein ACK3TF_001444 [Chlorella vulgaris]
MTGFEAWQQRDSKAGRGASGGRGGRVAPNGSAPSEGSKAADRGSNKATKRQASCELSLRAEEGAAPYIRLLAPLVRRNQATIWDHNREMKLSLVHLTFLPPHASLALLLAVWPMCQANREAQDCLAMLLGKGTIRRRLVAARGFFYLITQELQSGVAGTDTSPAFDPSQAGPSQARTYPIAVCCLQHMTTIASNALAASDPPAADPPAARRWSSLLQLLTPKQSAEAQLLTGIATAAAAARVVC